MAPWLRCRYSLFTLLTKHPSYLQDTPDFLRFLEEVRSEGPLPENTIIVSMDVSALYTNIPQDEGLEVVNEAMDNLNLAFPKEFITKLLELTLKYNIFEFNSELYLQMIGTAMGIRPAPSYANLFMAKIDKLATDLAQNFGDGTYPIKAWKRFLDDIFILWVGSVENLHAFLTELNLIHPTIKFTICHTSPNSEDLKCPCEPSNNLAFLDTSVALLDNQLTVDLYKKPTDRCQYLLPSSCHPPHITENIPFSLAYRIVRICTEPTTRDIRLEELKGLLVSRSYNCKLVDEAIMKAKNIPRERALERVNKEKDQSKRRPVFSVEYHPSLPAMPKLLQKHWRVMVEDPQLKEAFPLPPLVAYRRPQNLKEKLIRAKLPPAYTRPKRKTPGMSKCKFSCQTCPYVNPGKHIKANGSSYNHEIECSANCKTSNIVYCLSCSKCKEQYVGETEKSLGVRFGQHKGYVRNNKLDKATGYHFNLPGHSIADMRIAVMEKMWSEDPFMRETRETHYIKKMNSKHKGMNRKL